LHEELGAAFGLIQFSNSLRRAVKPEERPQKAMIGAVSPSDIAATSPTRCSKGVEPSVISDSKIGVGLYGVGTEGA
tara:strand:- start:34 stop:261 length:228 start_codon:yes stop_codon:yes gene_type:complete